MKKKNKHLTVFIIDDNLPKREEFIRTGKYNHDLNKGQLKLLVEKEPWKGEGYLLGLTKNLLDNDYTKKDLLRVFGFLHPEIALVSIKKNLKPDIIIYDWEYGDHLFQKSSEWLFSILNKTKAFVFVYSDYVSQAPPYLNKDDFIPFAHRFQLFLKGEKERSIFSSEEFILQFIFTRLSDNNTIKIQNMDVEFTSSGYLKKPTDILYLERILGKNFLIEQIKSVNNKLNKESLNNIMENAEGKVLVSGNKKYLIDPDYKQLVKSFSAKEEMPYLKVVQKYGLKKLLEALETGLVKIN